MYVGPTLTMQMGSSICLGPYVVGAKIPNPAKHFGGNCIVTSFPMPGICGDK
jgi:hypothetical protein